MAATSLDPLGQAVDTCEHDGRRALTLMRARYLAVALVLSVLIGLAVVDGFGADIYGVDATTERESAGGTELAVHHATVTHGGLATPFDIEVTRDGGFTAPVQVAVSSDYLGLFDENGLDPDPATAYTRGEWVVWEFDPPLGDSLHVSLDARLEPARQHGGSGEVALLEDDEPIIEIDVNTRVLP